MPGRTTYGRIAKLALIYEDAVMLEKHHRAKSRRQFHADSVRRLAKAKANLKSAVSKL